MALRFFSPTLRKAAVCATGLFGMTVMGILLWASILFLKNELDMFGIRGLSVAVLPLFFSLSALRFAVLAASPLTGTDEAGNRQGDRAASDDRG